MYAFPLPPRYYACFLSCICVLLLNAMFAHFCSFAGGCEGVIQCCCNSHNAASPWATKRWSRTKNPPHDCNRDSPLNQVTLLLLSQTQRYMLRDHLATIQRYLKHKNTRLKNLKPESAFQNVLSGWDNSRWPHIHGLFWLSVTYCSIIEKG